MNSLTLRVFAALMAGAAVISTSGAAQDASTPPVALSAPAAPSLSQQQLEQLVAPVALFDDSLLADVLTASTYPLEVVEADRWVSDPTNAELKGQALTEVLATQDWDPSIKALMPFPKVLQMIDDHLEWTENLGEAFLAQEPDVMDAVQRLRHRAQLAGTLKSTPQEVVANDGDDVTISPPPSDVIYIPSYDPWCAYGPWPFPVVEPFYTPWPGYCLPQSSLIAFDEGLFLPFEFWDWGYFDWHHHHIRIDRNRFDKFHSGHEPRGTVWQHDPTEREGVPYRDPRNAGRYEPAQVGRPSFRGYPSQNGVPAEAVRPPPPAFEDFGSGATIRGESQRGQSSRGGMSSGGPRGIGGGRGDGRGGIGPSGGSIGGGHGGGGQSGGGHGGGRGH